VSAIEVRGFRPGDGAGIARIGRENSAYYARLAPQYFKEPNEGALADMLEGDDEWRNADENLALVAEVEGNVAGYLEASVHPPLETAECQGQRDLAFSRLFIGVVETADAYKRMGVATRLVEAAEEWGRSQGAVVAVCDTYIDSPLSVPFWEERMGYTRRSIIFRKPLSG
jgi:GNAT superfamily N-acetyltransferase